MLFALVGGAVLAYTKGFTKKWRRLVREEFEKHNLVVDFSQLTLDPFRGLVMRNVILYDGEDQNHILAKINNVSIDIDFAGMIRKQLFLDRIELRYADLNLPIGDEEEVKLENLKATVFLPGNRIQMDEAVAELEGVRIHLTAMLVRPPTTAELFSPGDVLRSEQARSLFRQIRNFIGDTQFTHGKRPELFVEISGDLGRPDSLRAVLQFLAEDFTYRDYHFTNSELLMDWSAGEVDIKKIYLNDGIGNLNGTGRYTPGEDHVKLYCRSTMRWQEALATMAPGTMDGLPFEGNQAPVITAEGKLFFQSDDTRWPLDLVGSVNGRAARILNLECFRYSSDFHIGDKAVLFRDIDLTTKYGEIKGSVYYAPETGWKYKSDLKVGPDIVSRLDLPEGFSTFLGKWDFGDEPTVGLRLEGEGSKIAAMTHTGRLDLTKCSFNGAALGYLGAEFSYDGNIFQLSQARTEFLPDQARGYPGGRLEADAVIFSPATGLYNLRNIRGDILPAQAVRPFSSKVADHLERYSFKNPPSVVIEGTMDPGSSEQTNLAFTIKSDSLVYYPFLKKDLPLAKPLVQGRLFRQNLTINKLEGELLGGKVKGKVIVQDLGGRNAYNAQLDLERLSFPLLAELYFPEKTTAGELTANMSWTGVGSDFSTVEGRGSGHVLNGEIAAVPVLGPLSSIIGLVGQNSISHGVVRDLNGAFTLKDGVVKVDDLVADMKIYQITGEGKIDVMENTLDFEVALSNKTAAGALLSLLYKVLGTYRATGSWDKPEWRAQKLLKPLRR